MRAARLPPPGGEGEPLAWFWDNARWLTRPWGALTLSECACHPTLISAISTQQPSTRGRRRGGEENQSQHFHLFPVLPPPKVIWDVSAIWVEGEQHTALGGAGLKWLDEKTNYQLSRRRHFLFSCRGADGWHDIAVPFITVCKLLPISQHELASIQPTGKQATATVRLCLVALLTPCVTSWQTRMA